MSKKALLGGAVIVAAAFGVSPYFTGNALETNFKKQVAALDAQPAYAAEVVSYEKGYFTSSALVRVTIDLASMAADNDELPETIEAELDFSAQHGLLLTQYSPGVGLAAWQLSLDGNDLQEYVEWEDGTPIYQMTGSVGLFGGADYHDWMPELTAAENADGVAFNFSGYEGHGTVEQERVVYTGGFKDMTLSVGDQARFKMSDLNLQVDAQASLASLLAGSVYGGDSSFSIKEVSFEDVEMTQPLILSNYQLTSTSNIDEEQNTASIVIKQGLESVSSESFTANDLVFNMSMDDLDISVLEAFQQFASAQDGTDPAKLLEQQSEFFIQQLPKIIDDNPSFKIDQLSASLEQGEMNADMFMQLADIEQLPDPIDDQAFWFSHVNSEANMRIEKPVALWLAQKQILMQLRTQLPPAQQDPVQMQQIAEQQAPLVISTFMQQGFLTEQEDAYVTKVTLKDGKFVLNGTELPVLQALQQQ